MNESIRKNLVYTSAGDRSNLHCWLQGERNFDLWVTYYGDVDGRYRDVADFYDVGNGAKWQNFHAVYASDTLRHYDAILVLDDDILIDGAALSRLFEIRSRYDLWLLQPAFHPRGKISHPITRARPSTFLRFTDFVELGCPLFRKDRLDEFMKVYDPRLALWGIDWWYLHVLGPDLQGKVAVVDAITCINPFDRHKPGGTREVERVKSIEEDKRTWIEFKKRHGIPSGEERGVAEYGAIALPLRPALKRLLPIYAFRILASLRARLGMEQ